MESVTVGAASTPSEEEALAALTAEAESAPTTTEEALAARDASKEAPKLPEKFKSTEDLLKAYQELERKLGAGEAAEAEVETEVTEDVAGEAELPEDLEVTEDDVEEEAAAEDEEPLTGTEVVEYLTDRFAAQDGSLSDDDYALAEEMGYDRAMVDGYIAGQQALAEQATAKIHEAAGGADALQSMLVWAATGLTPAEIEVYNSTLADNDVSKATAGVAKLRAAYEASQGIEPKLLGGKPARAEASVFTSWAEVTAAMSDPRYGTKDAKYTADVAAKLARSSI